MSRREWFESTAEALIDAKTAAAALADLSPASREIVVLRIWSDRSFRADCRRHADEPLDRPRPLCRRPAADAHEIGAAMQFDEETNLTPADRELEAALKSLAPSRSTRVNPVDAAFTAGGRSARRQLRVWQSATAALMLVAIGSWLPTRGGRAAAPPTVIATVPIP
jgi:hypothetical protein